MGVGMGAFSLLVPLLIGLLGFEAMGIIVGVFALVALWGPPLGISEGDEWKDEEAEGEKGLPFKEAIVETVKNKPMAIFLVACFVYQTIFNTIIVVAPYVVDVLLRLPEEMAIIIFGSIILSGIVFIPVVRKLSTMWTKKKILLIGFIIAGLTLPFFAFVDLIGVLPTVPLAVLLAAINGFPIIGYYTIENAILGDIVDKDEEKTGFRREGMFSGIRGLVTKMGIGIGTFGATMIMQFFGYTRFNPTGIRIVFIVLAVLAFVGFFIFRKFPIEE